MVRHSAEPNLRSNDASPRSGSHGKAHPTFNGAPRIAGRSQHRDDSWRQDEAPEAPAGVPKGPSHASHSTSSYWWTPNDSFAEYAADPGPRPRLQFAGGTGGDESLGKGRPDVGFIILLLIAALLFRWSGDPWEVVAGKLLAVVALYLVVIYVVFGVGIGGL